MVEFIDQNRDEFDVESICRVLPIASSTYYAAKRRETEPCARARRDAVMMPILLALWIANRKVYGAHKLWKAAQRAGHVIGRDQVARLMRELEIRGVTRRRRVFTTKADPDATRAADLVNRDFTASGSDALWVTDLSRSRPLSSRSPTKNSSPNSAPPSSAPTTTRMPLAPADQVAA